MNNIKNLIRKITEETILSCGNGIIAPLGIRNNEIECVDFSIIDNLIICGTVGSGKTTFVRTLMASLISTNKPEKIKFCLFNSKKTDYIEFSNVPHLIMPVISDAKKCIGMMLYVLSEAQKREQAINEKGEDVDVPEIFLVLDDYANVSKEPNVQETLCDLLKIAHRVKVHVIIVTSIALARIISTELKVLVPHRISFFLPEKVNSRVVIDQNGAETLEMPGEFISKFHGKVRKYRSIELSNSEIKQACEMGKK